MTQTDCTTLCHGNGAIPKVRVFLVCGEKTLALCQSSQIRKCSENKSEASFMKLLTFELQTYKNKSLTIQFISSWIVCQVHSYFIQWSQLLVEDKLQLVLVVLQISNSHVVYPSFPLNVSEEQKK